MSDGQPGRAAGEPAVGDQCAGFAQALGLEITGGVQHFLHARAAPRPLVADNNHSARADPVFKDIGYRGFLAFADMRRAGKRQDAVVHARGFYHAAVLCDVAKQHCQTPFLGIGVFHIPHAASGTIEVQAGPSGCLAEGLLGGNTAGSCGKQLLGRIVLGGGNIPVRECLRHGAAVHRAGVGINQSAPGQLAQNRHYATRPVNVLHMVKRCTGSDLAQLRHPAAQHVDVGHGKIDPGFLGCRQQVQDGVG